MTFVTCSDPRIVAKHLSDLNLGKQRVEAVQILNILLKPDSGGAWSQHPIAKAWQGHTNGLKYYINCMIDEFEARGKNNNMERQVYDDKSIVLPWWFGWERLHMNHRAILSIKNPWHYNSTLFEINPEYLSYGYIWPHTIVAESQLTAPLSEITAELPDYLKNPQYCTGVFKNGKRCIVLVKKGTKCGKHNK